MCSEEPFRVFFPLGLIAGLVGLLLWPLFLWQMWESYPGVVHARLMVEGFMGAFIFGFLGTAGPRLLGSRHLSFAEVATLLGLHVAALATHLAGYTQAGDVVFFVLLLGFAVSLGRRFVAAEELPPPNFVLVGCGLLSALVGTGFLILGHGNAAFAQLYVLGGLLLNQGFVLLPVLGVGVFLFPRFLGVPFGPEFEEMRKLTPWWTRKALLAGGCALLMVGSFVWETFGYVREAGAARFVFATLYIATQMPAVLGFGPCPFLGKCVRASTWMLLLGLLWPVLLPLYRVAGLHLIFIGGFMLVTFTVATRVMLGHSGQSHLFRRPLPFLTTAAVLLVVGLIARIAADFMPSVAGRNSHLVYAALLCIAAGVLWGVRLVPRVLIADSEE